MTPQEFEQLVKSIVDGTYQHQETDWFSWKASPVIAHAHFDSVVEDLLCDLGYGDGIALTRGLPRDYGSYKTYASEMEARYTKVVKSRLLDAFKSISIELATLDGEPTGMRWISTSTDRVADVVLQALASLGQKQEDYGNPS